MLDGQVVAEVGSNGLKWHQYVYADGQLLATENYIGMINGQVIWQHIDPSNASWWSSTPTPSQSWVAVELDPAGANVETYDPYLDPNPGEGEKTPPTSGQFGSPESVERCSLDGIDISCSNVMLKVNSGAAAVCPNNDCGARRNGSHFEFWNPSTGWRALGARTAPVLHFLTPAQKQERKRNRARDRARSNRIGRDERNPGTSSQDSRAVFLNLTPLMNKIRWVNSGNNYPAEMPEYVSRIQGRIYWMLSSKACAEAFKRAGLPTPEEIINKGLTIAARPLLDNPDNNC